MRAGWEKVPDWARSNSPGQEEFSYASGFLLAGGKSTRMGQDKALLIFEGETLAERGLRKLHEVCADVAIAGGDSRLSKFGRVIPDGYQDCGPLGGIVAALEQTSREWNLFLAVDMPFVPVAALRGLLFGAGGMGGRSLIGAAQAQGVLQPLCAVYSRRALPILRAELEAGRYKVKNALVATWAYSLVPFENLDWFRNINTPEDFKLAQGLK